MIVVFIALLAIVIAKNQEQERSVEERKSVEEALVFPDFNPDAVASMTIQGLQTGIVEFKKEAGYWMVANGGNHPVMGEAVEEVSGEDEDEAVEEALEEPSEGEDGSDDDGGEKVEKPEKKLSYFRADETQVVDGVLKKIKEIPLGKRVSTDKEKHNQFQVSEILAFEVTARDSDDNELAHFFVGNASDQLSSSNYMRFSADSDDVYEIKGAWRNLVGKPFTAWRNKTMFYFDPNSILNLELYGTEDGDLAFSKDDNGIWNIEGQDWEIDDVRFGNIIDTMSTLQATDFAPIGVPLEETGLDAPVQRVAAAGAEGTFELAIGNVSEAGKYYCLISGDDETIFMVNEPDIKAMLVGRERLEKAN
jgi:hypothetical protein